MSNGSARVVSRKRRASLCSTRPALAPHSWRRAAISRAAAGSRSTKVTCAAPRDSASSPSAPLPAKRSRQRAPGTRGASQLKRVSRTRSGVGRISCEGGKRRRRPCHAPRAAVSVHGHPLGGAKRCFAERHRLALCLDRVMPSHDSVSMRTDGRYTTGRNIMFGRKPKDGAAEAEERQGFFKKLRSRLNRGNSWLTYDLANLFKGRQIDAQILEELETRLLIADVGVEATEDILTDLRKRVARKELADVEALVNALRDAIVEILEPCARPLAIDESRKPFVILVVGVNGSGKTTTIGKLARELADEGRSV